MSILIVGNVVKDIYLNLDDRTETFETDSENTKWLDLAFNASEHHFFNRTSTLGGAAITLEVLAKFGLDALITNSDLKLTPDGLSPTNSSETYRYILLTNRQPCYLVPTTPAKTIISTPSESYNYVFVDRSANLDAKAANTISAYLDISPRTKLILYVKNLDNPHFNTLLPRANLVFAEDHASSSSFANFSSALIQNGVNKGAIIHISDHVLSYSNITEPVTINSIDAFTHLSAYSIAAASILGCFVLGKPIKESLRIARANLENSRLNATLSLNELEPLATPQSTNDNLELLAKSLLMKGILATDESGGSIHKKFHQLHIPDTYDNRRDYRNIFFTTKQLEKYVSGIILFDETARQTADNGQNFVEYLISKRIIPGIKVDQGLAPLSSNSLETITKGLDNLPKRLAEYYQMGLRFAKWRAAFEIKINTNNQILTPTQLCITKNCQILAQYALACQKTGLVPIVEPEVVYDGYYSIQQSAEVTSTILDQLFQTLIKSGVNLRACILKTNMILSGKRYEVQSTPSEVGLATATVLKQHIPAHLAGVVFLSGGQTVEQATNNLAAIIKQGPFPWPVTFSFARALQDPALYAWAGDNKNTAKAQQAFYSRLIANTKALKPTK